MNTDLQILKMIIDKNPKESLEFIQEQYLGKKKEKKKNRFEGAKLKFLD